MFSIIRFNTVLNRIHKFCHFSESKIIVKPEKIYIVVTEVAFL